MSQNPIPHSATLLPVWRYIFLAGCIMAYGWGYRGTVGHEGGAMVPAALLGLVLCLGSGRTDWYRRSAVVALFAAGGWCWGGSISYMEHTFYIQSGSLLDVAYGYSMLFFIGALWAGCGGAALGLALTLPRSELHQFIRPFAVISTVFLVVYSGLFANPVWKENLETLTVNHFHDGDWLSATLTLIVSGLYWILRPQDRKATAWFFFGAVAWWVGYGLLTKLGGIRLAPLHRSESWGGVLGILVLLIIMLIRTRNRAALMLCLYAILGGGFAFALAVFLRHPMVFRVGIFEHITLAIPSWRFAEDSFGFFMAIAVALGTLRLIRGRLMPPEENTSRGASDAFAAFVLLVALSWIDFRRHIVRVLKQSSITEQTDFFGLQLGHHFFIVGCLLTLPILYALYRYWKGDRQLVPQSSFGKGVLLCLLLLWGTVSAQLLDGPVQRMYILNHLVLWIPAGLATLLLLSLSPHASQAITPTDGVSRHSTQWRVGWKYGLLWCCMPLCIYGFSTASIAMQGDAVVHDARYRFGEKAYW